MKILIVDDERLQRQLLRINLKRGGFEVIEAPDGRAAWKVLEREPVQLVITDWLMPDMDGPDLIRRIRAAGFPHYVYTILLTVRDDKADVVRGLESGADDYLTKPFNGAELMARVSIGVRIVELETRLRESMEQLHQLATYDSLTGVFNRRSIYEHASAEWDRARRTSTPFSLVLLDADRFKSVNDRFGHAVGDQALQHIAQLVLANRRPYDWVGRWGGEEFLVVLPGAGSHQGLLVAERLCRAVANTPLDLPDVKDLQLVVSLGVSSSHGHNDFTVDELIQQADRALYQAKREGGNRARLFDPGQSADFQSGSTDD